MDKSKLKPMDVVFIDCIHHPIALVLEVSSKGNQVNTTIITESGGEDYNRHLMSRDEWLEWLNKFSDDLTGREFREAREAVLSGFKEPELWADFRERYAQTGTPWEPWPDVHQPKKED